MGCSLSSKRSAGICFRLIENAFGWITFKCRHMEGLYYLFNEQPARDGREGRGELFIRSLIAHLRTIDNRRWEGRKTSEAYSMTFQISPNSVCTGEWRDNACCACYLIREFSYTYARAVFVKKSGNMLERRTIRGRITYDSLRG